MAEITAQFEQRKIDHIRIALEPRSQATSMSQFDQIQLHHEALPEIDFQDVKIETKFNQLKIKSPFIVSSMTAGHSAGQKQIGRAHV